MTSENKHQINLAIMASGSGTNAQNLILFAKKHNESTQGEQENSFLINICCVISNIEGAGVLEKASKLGIKTHVVSRQKKESREKHEERLTEVLSKYDLDWICLAGYMRVLGPTFLNNFFDRNKNISKVINIHPSLLPAFPGLHAYEQAFEANVSEAGATVHFVDQGIDTGPQILQMSFTREPKDTLESFKERGMKNEYKLYPQALIKIINEYNLKLNNKGQ